MRVGGVTMFFAFLLHIIQCQRMDDEEHPRTAPRPYPYLRS
jgi:hypothetical protein